MNEIFSGKKTTSLYLDSSLSTINAQCISAPYFNENDIELFILFQATQNIFLFSNVFKTYFLSTEDGTDCSFLDASINKCE